MENSNLKLDMIDYIAKQSNHFFKLQQINDPEFDLYERKKILEETLEQSHLNFLMRFGSCLKVEHTVYFDNPENYTTDQYYQIQFYLNLIKQNSNLYNDVTVKNRRYEAMKKLEDEGNYFSEIEMMKREPLLYHEFIGQYLTQSEVNLRDEEKNKSFLNIIFATIDHKTTNELKRKQENDILMPGQYKVRENSNETEIENHLSNDSFNNSTQFQKLWGEFDDNLSQHHYNVNVRWSASSINEDQRNFLRNEFIGIMQSKFLSGSDEDFDYTTVDLDQNYDNLEMVSRDEEDKYFDSEDAFERSKITIQNESEDELDVFMKTLDSLK